MNRLRPEPAPLAPDDTSQRAIIVTTEHAFDALQASWRQLQTALPHALPFQTFAWCRAWWRHFAVQSATRHDHLHIVCFYAGTYLVGILPLVASNFGLLGVPLYRYKRPFGADKNLTEIRAPLVLPDYAEWVWRYWLDMVNGRRLGTTLHQLVAPEVPVHAMAKACPLVHEVALTCFSSFVIEPGTNWQSYKQGLKRNIKESLRRCYNSVAREGWRPELMVLSGHGAVSAALPHFYALHAERAQADNTVAHPDYFATAQNRAFLEEVIQRFEGRGSQVHLFCLQLDGQTVAMRLGFSVGDELYMYYSGFDQRYGKYSVMTTLLAETIQWAMSAGLQRINLSKGSDVSKTRWSPQAYRYIDAHYVKNRPLGRRYGQLMVSLKQLKA